IGNNPQEPWMNFLTGQQSANYIYRAFEVGQSLDYMGPMFLWNLNFANPTTVGARSDIAGFALAFQNENGDLNPRDAYNTLATLLQ
ncbi:MAG: hypothetical protein AAF125_13140, partial [Chloroflexota bacterium]